jgi:formate/nitrite transporter FocA (FNT family)
MGAVAAKAATTKAALDPLEAFTRGALCNALVCLAVWLSFSARTTTDKILAILWPVTAFVALGLEHSIANMFLFPAGLWAGADITAANVAGNLIWVSLGNIVGGAGGVALSYRYAFGAMRG